MTTRLNINGLLYLISVHPVPPLPVEGLPFLLNLANINMTINFDIAKNDLLAGMARTM